MRGLQLSAAAARKALRAGASVAATLLFATSFAFSAPKPHDEPAFVKAIHFKDGVIDAVHTMTLDDQVVGFGPAPPQGAFSPKFGMFIRWLTCRPATSKPYRCQFVMMMHEFESRSRFCYVWPGVMAGATLAVECPTKIEWLPLKR